jgi:hypothetical protein
MGAESVLSEQFVELVVRAEPRPFDSITTPFADHANIPAHSHRPIIGVTAELFKLERIVPRVFPKQSKARRAALFCTAFNSSYASQKLRVVREITCDSNRVARFLRLSLAL